MLHVLRAIVERQHQAGRQGQEDREGDAQGGWQSQRPDAQLAGHEAAGDPIGASLGGLPGVLAGEGLQALVATAAYFNLMTVP